MTRKGVMKLSPCRLGFIQALGVTVYCSLVGVFFWKGNDIFGKANRYAGPVVFLLLFISSAMICALMVFYQPYLMFFEGKKKEALKTVVNTAGWLFIAFVIFLVFMFVR